MTRNAVIVATGGNIRLAPLAGGGSMAHWNQNIGALVSTAVGTFGSGGTIRLMSTLHRLSLAA
jgi:hypothetical protein